MIFPKNNKLMWKSYHTLQPHRIQEILLVSSLYDAYIFEEDGQLTERIFNDYVDLNLHYAPRVTHVTTSEKAINILKKKKFDLIITTQQLKGMNVLNFCRDIKKFFNKIPIVLLTPVLNNVSEKLKIEWNKNFDAVFSWNGDTKIFLAIIKLIEDTLNVEHDTKYANVRIILVVEDSIKRYSYFLPLLYFEIMNQTKSLISDSVNQHSKIFRMRARPKVVLAKNYEEAVDVCTKYKDYLIGIISDVSFFKNNKNDDEAGLKLIKYVKKMIPDIPTILHSAESTNRDKAVCIGSDFLNKNSPTLVQELGDFLQNNLGFGVFKFKMPDGKIIDQAVNLKELEQKVKNIPDESILFHAKKNHFSTWLMARGEFLLANQLRSQCVDEFDNIKELRDMLSSALNHYRIILQQGVISDFSRTRFNPEQSFNRLGTGSMGGKARGLAFVNSLLATSYNNFFSTNFSNLEIAVPSTTVICTDEFDKFIKDNNLNTKISHYEDDESIAKEFLNVNLSKEIIKDLSVLLEQFNKPIAVRSSSLLEDSHAQPFAGIYSTYMLPNNSPSINVRLEQLMSAIKLIYASIFYNSSKSYLLSTGNRIEEEKMAIIIQQVVGREYGDSFYPDFSGVYRSVNFFPFSRMKPEDGVAYLALGLGKTISDGFNTIHFSPKHAEIIPQFLTIKSALQNSQKQFYAVDMNKSNIELSINRDATLIKHELDRAEQDGTLQLLGSVYDAENSIIREGLFYQGSRLVSFAHILKSNIFPLSELLDSVGEMIEVGLGTHVEIEFAVELAKSEKEKSKFNFLQVRPMILNKEDDNVLMDGIDTNNLLCYSSKTLGNGIIKNIDEIIFVKPDKFDASKTRQIALEVGELNSTVKSKALFIGMGRWGTSDHWLGIPVTWNQISNAAVLLEASLENYNIDPSYGSHFFHNITSLGLAYLTITNTGKDKNNFIDWKWLLNQTPSNQTEHVCYLKLKAPLQIIINGKKREGCIFINKNKTK